MTKKNVMIDESKNILKTGIMSMGGMAAVGALGNVAGPEASKMIPTIGAGLSLANVGQMVSSTKNMTESMFGESPKKSKKGNSVVDKFF